MKKSYSRRTVIGGMATGLASLPIVTPVRGQSDEREESKDNLFINCGLEHLPDTTPGNTTRTSIHQNRQLTEDENTYESISMDPLPHTSHANLYQHTPDVIQSGNNQDIYLTEYWAPDRLDIDIPVKQGQYEVKIHLAEFFYNYEGARIFSIDINEETLVDDIDLYDEFGFGVATVKKTTVESNNNNIKINAESKIENPKISAIEVNRL